MFRQILTGLVLLAFVNFIMGCRVTTLEKIPGQEGQQIKEKVTGLVLLDGSTVTFNETGGSFSPIRDSIRGRSADGKPVAVSSGRALQCRISPPKTIGIADLDSAHIAELVLRSNLLVTFQEPGGRYDKGAQKVTGKTVDGNRASYRLAIVKSIRTEKPTTINIGELKKSPQQPVYEVIDTDGFLTAFDSTGGLFGRQNALFVGRDVLMNHIEIPADSVLYANVVSTDAAGSVLATLGVIVGVLGVIALIALATKQSCPFIYSFDGQQFVFDAEPLGGAICAGLARTDISSLDFVKPLNGEYRLLVRNEVPETQYIDRMRLLVIDHPADAHVYPDLQGNFYSFTQVRGAASACDEQGMSLMNFLRASDKVAWQTHLPSASKAVTEPVRHELRITLPKPVDAKRAWLITNIGTSSWGSNMIRKTVEYRGATAGAWLKSLTPGSQSYVEMQQFLEREEMYNLKTWVKEGESWKQEGVIVGQGPFVSEDRVYPIDVSNVVGDSLVLRFNPPKGFWTFDYLGVSYENPTVMHASAVEASRAEDHRETSILGPLASIDDKYYSMPEVGDWANISFDVPAQPPATVRSVYLETRGYYELHLPHGIPDQLARLYEIGMNPGQIVKATMEEYRSWEAGQQAVLSRSQSE